MGKSDNGFGRFVLDKLVFATVVALVAATASFFASRLNTAWEFQADLFEKRFAAYAELAAESASLQRSVNLLLGPPTEIGGADPAQVVHRLRQRIKGASGGSISWAPEEDVLSQLERVRDAWEAHRWLAPEPVAKAFASYILSVADCLDAYLDLADRDARREVGGIAEQGDYDASFRRVGNAYDDFVLEMRGSLGLDLSPTRPLGRL